MPTIKDVAQLAGVSTATVSATLNKSAYVSPALQERVQQAVNTLGYAPSTVARSLKMGRTRMIGLVISDITNSFFCELVQCIEATAHSSGYTVLLGHSGEDVGKEIELLRLMQAQRVDGVILAPTGHAADYRRAGLSTYPVPLALIDRVVPPFDADVVLVDNHDAAFKATMCLIESGHQRIGTIAGPGVTTGAERLAGFRAALQRFGLPADPSLIIEGDFRQSSGEAACHAIMTLPEPPTALFVANSQMLIGAMRGLAAMGLRCPEDVSVVAMDDMPWMTAFSPRMTVVRQPIQIMGQAVIGLMMERLEGGASSERRKIVVQAELIERDSVRCALERSARLLVPKAGSL